MKSRILKSLLFLSLAVICSCSEKFDITQFQSGKKDANVGGDTVYVPLSPEWTGFNKPQDIFIGKEPFIYVADTDNDRIVMLNLDGKVLGTKSIKKPIAIGQDYKLNLFVCGEFDTTINNKLYTLSAVYKIEMVPAQHLIENANIIRILPRPSDLNNIEVAKNRKYTGVATFYNNSYFVTRTGPNNTSLIDPDNSILVFNQFSGKDSLMGRVPQMEPEGTGLASANKISSITSFKKRNTDIVITLAGENSFKAQWLTYVVTTENSKYESRLSAEDTEFMIPDRFSNPEGSCIDGYGNIFIADPGKDSIYKFSPQGEELESFGGHDVFNKPYAVGFFDKTLYVVDTYNNRILRFILSTDLQ